MNAINPTNALPVVPGVTITLDTIYAELTALRAEVVRLGIDDVKGDVKDHEHRIRELEKWVWRAGAIGVIGGAGLGQVLGLIGL